jgi:hypothetical protein
MTDRQPTPEALEAARAIRCGSPPEPLKPWEIVPVALALDDFAATALKDWTGDKPTPCREDASDRCATILSCHLTCQRFAGSAADLSPVASASVKRGYDAAIEMLRRHNRKLYGDAPQYLADWLDADNVRPPEVK